jgi:hypothetical protein
MTEGDKVRFHESNGTLMFTVGNVESATFEIVRPDGQVLFGQTISGNLNYAYQFPFGMEPTGPRLCRYVTEPGDGKWRVIHAWEWNLDTAQVLLAYEQLGKAADNATKAFNQLNEVIATKPSLYASEFAEYYGLE